MLPITTTTTSLRPRDLESVDVLMQLVLAPSKSHPRERLTEDL